jgi:hypothetical protein
MRADLQERHIHLLQKQIDDSDAALKLELARGEKHAEALMHIARSCDDRVDEIKTHHAAAVTSLKAELEAVKASHAVTIGKLETQHAAVIAALENQVAVLRLHAMSKLTDIHAAIAALQTLEIHPIRADHRQFAEWHTGPVPSLPTPPQPPPPPCVAFDRGWCTAACGARWKVDVDDATGVRARVTQDVNDWFVNARLCLRSAAPLQRRCSAHAPVANGHQQGQLPAYRIIIEAYDSTQSCRLGFLAGAAHRPIVGQPIEQYGGWSIMIQPSSAGFVGLKGTRSGWTPLDASCSTYATTSIIPPVPPGSAVEFAVDYAAGTCRVAFYTPAAVAGGFVEAPHAKMELRFVATDADAKARIPARSIPTLADSGVELYPAAEAGFTNATWRLVS